MPFICKVCGFPNLNEEPRGDATGGSYEICPSCGIQFGFHDEAGGDPKRRLKVYEEWRQAWIGGGMVWDKGRTEQPPDWNPVEQLRNVIRAG